MTRRTEEQWRTLINQQKESGLSAAQFCKEQSINPKYFSTVKYKLKNKVSASNKFQAIQTSTMAQPIIISSGNTQVSIPLSVDATWLAIFTKNLAQ